MLKLIKYTKIIAKIRKTPWFSRLRQYFPMPEEPILDDRHKVEDAEIVKMDWPAGLKKPKMGIAQDYGVYPRWTKYRRFLENNDFEYGIYNLHGVDWVEEAQKYDIILGFVSSELWHLQEMREKYYFLEAYLGKMTYPSPGHANLFEDKSMEAFIASANDLPFAKSHISYEKEDAFRLVESLTYPAVSKIVPASGSLGVELVRNKAQARKIVEQAFSRNGRKSHLVIFRQKNYVYFQDFVPNDGYDIRAIVVGNWVFGYYRKVLDGDFRASGMNMVEKRELPAEAMKVAIEVNQVVKSPMLVVDMVHGLDGKYTIIEYSPVCQMEFPEQLHVNGVPGVYIFSDDVFRFEKGRYWVHELALREFLLKDYIPSEYSKKK